MFTTDLHGQGHRKADPAQERMARAWAAQYGHPAPPAGKSFAEHYGTAGSAGVDLATGASLDAAVAAGQRALCEGYGSVLPDGQAPCGTCASCTYGHPEGCRRPVGKAMATLRRHQAQADRLDQADADLADLQRLSFQLMVRRQMAC